MNKKRRMKNRETARQLARDTAPPCPNCGEKGTHWVGVPMSLADFLAGTEEASSYVDSIGLSKLYEDRSADSSRAYLRSAWSSL